MGYKEDTFGVIVYRLCPAGSARLSFNSNITLFHGRAFTMKLVTVETSNVSVYHLNHCALLGTSFLSCFC